MIYLLRTLLVTAVLLTINASVSWACSCMGVTRSLNRTLGKAPTAVVGKVKNFYEHGALIEVEKVVKGEVQKKQIVVWGDPGHLCRFGVSPGALGKRKLILINPLTKNSIYGDHEKPGDFEFLSCSRSDYDIVVHEKSGNDRVQGPLESPNASNSISLETLTRWVSNPDVPVKLSTNARLKSLIDNPSALCRASYNSAIYRKTQGDRDILVGTGDFVNDQFPQGYPQVVLSKNNSEWKAELHLVFRGFSAWWSPEDNAALSESEKSKVLDWVEKSKIRLNLDGHLSLKTDQFHSANFESKISIEKTNSSDASQLEGGVSFDREQLDTGFQKSPWNIIFSSKVQQLDLDLFDDLYLKLNLGSSCQM